METSEIIRPTGRFRNWIGGRSQEYQVQVQLIGHTIVFNDLSRQAAICWVPVAILIAVAYLGAHFMGGVPLLPTSWHPWALIAFFAAAVYRIARTLSRRCRLTVDLETDLVQFDETWPSRRQVKASLAECIWVIQPIYVSDLRFAWNGHILHVNVLDEWYTLGIKKGPSPLRSIIPSALRDRIQIETFPATLYSPLPL